MRLEIIGVLAKREYLSRVRTPAFWLGTLALPLVMAGMMFLPHLLLSTTKVDHHLVLVDETGKVGPLLVERLKTDAGGAQQADFQIDLEAPAADTGKQRGDLDRRVLAGDIAAWVWVSQPGIDANEVEYHAESISNFVTQELLEDGLSDVVRRVRFADAGFDPDVIAKMAQSVSLSTVKVSEEGSKEEESLIGMAIAYFLFFLLYMVIMIYGSQVLNGVLEEKTSRVVEVIISTVRPFELMMGKLLGIGAVGLTQLGIWLASTAIVTAPGIVTAMAWIPEGVEIPTLSLPLVVNFFGLFMLGYFLFATFYAAVGSAFNNLQEAQQVATVAAFVFVVPLMFFPVVMNDPDSTVAVVTSLIPPLTPMLMMLRIAVKMPPLWQILLGYLLTASFTVLMVAICARIYRVGILMYGKKPTFKELWRWLRYA